MRSAAKIVVLALIIILLSVSGVGVATILDADNVPAEDQASVDVEVCQFSEYVNNSDQRGNGVYTCSDTSGMHTFKKQEPFVIRLHITSQNQQVQITNLSSGFDNTVLHIRSTLSNRRYTPTIPAQETRSLDVGYGVDAAGTTAISITLTYRYESGEAGETTVRVENIRATDEHVERRPGATTTNEDRNFLLFGGVALLIIITGLIVWRWKRAR